MAEKLTPQQQQVVENRGGRLLVSAAAGSGKTKVLVDRLMGYITDPIHPANIDDFLIITYTKAAASELRGKIAVKLAEKMAQDPSNRHLQRQQQRLYLAKISTVHAFCGDILREYAYRLDLSADFRVADEQECDRIRETVMEKVLQDAYAHPEQGDFFAFVDTQGVGRNDRNVPEYVMQVYDSARCHLSPDQWLQHCLEQTNTEKICDASQSEYGAFLIKRLHDWLQLQIGSLSHCVHLCRQTQNGEKVAALLDDTICRLENLRNCDTWNAVFQNRQIDFGRLVFPKTFGDEELKEQIKAVRDACKKGLERQTKAFCDNAEQILSDLRASSAAARGLVELVRSFSKEFDRAKKNRRILDFGDLEHIMLDLLLGKSRTGLTAAAREIGSRFREVMVDEYQDSNAVQDAIYAALTDERHNLFMVGDVKQSIYQFRLADPGIFLEKYNTFLPVTEAKTGEDRKVLLSSNFRSSGGVLSACNDVFYQCMCPEVGGLYYGPEEALYEGIPHIALPEADAELCCIDVKTATYPEEAAYVAHRIRNLLDGTHFVRQGDEYRPVKPEDIVILLRSPGSAGGYYEQALTQAGIRYTTGGGLDLLKTDEIVAIRACLQAIHNPRMDIPLIAALASPIFCFTADDLAAIRSCRRTGPFLDAMLQHEGKKTKAFLDLLSQLRTVARRETLTVLLEKVFRFTKLEAVYGAMEHGTQRVSNIQAFYQLASEFESTGGKDLGRFLEHLDAMDLHGLILPGEASAQGCVTIMSIHKSKGLEFPVVFLCGLGREFNMEGQRAPILCHKSMGLGLNVADNAKRIRYPTIAKRAIAARMGQEMLSEELRVLYVAMTRARDRLIMTYASNRLQKDLAEIVHRLSVGGKELLIRDTVCPGEWVLLTALQKTEAGELFALAGSPRETTVSNHPWKISVVTAPEILSCHTATDSEVEGPTFTEEALSQMLSFQYTHAAATVAPSKMTATQRKGRVKDEEAAQDTVRKITQRQWRKPGFASKSGKDYGNAIHAVMQYIDYGKCVDAASVEDEIHRLVTGCYISAEQAQLVDGKAIAAFFATPMGKRIQTGEVSREFKFSILEDAEAYGPDLNGEHVLLQGVVDCVLFEEDGITILDFKTDCVTGDAMLARAESYRPQVEAYAEAMCRIFRRPVKETLLYFFHTGQFVGIH